MKRGADLAHATGGRPIQLVAVGVRDPGADARRRDPAGHRPRAPTWPPSPRIPASTSWSSCSAGSSQRATSSRLPCGGGRSVVTANKALLARRGAELEAEARRTGAALRFEAAVGGGIPVLGPLGGRPGRQPLVVHQRHRQRHHQLHPDRDDRRAAGTTRPCSPTPRRAATPRPTRAATSRVATRPTSWPSSSGWRSAIGRTWRPSVWHRRPIGRRRRPGHHGRDGRDRSARPPSWTWSSSSWPTRDGATTASSARPWCRWPSRPMSRLLASAA